MQWKTRALTVLAIVLIAAGIGLLLLVGENGHLTPHAPTDDGPSSVKLGRQTIDSYQVPPDLPRYIAIPSIKVPKTRVIQLGVDKNNKIAVPNNIYDTGWYKDSAKPGQNGAMFIYGHVSNWTANGIFYNLKKLQPGDKIIITRGDNKVFTYRVDTTKTYPYDKVPMQTVLAPTDSSKPGLNLMTCTGQIIKGTSEFNERLVVFATLTNT